MLPKALHELRAAVAAGPPYSAGLLRELRADTRVGARALYERCLRVQADSRAERRRLDAMWRFERLAHEQGFVRVAGIDEAGRGPLAGPIVAAAVVLAYPVEGLNDSKQLTPGQREALFDALASGRHDIGVAKVEAVEIDRIGIQAANYRAMAQAVAQLKRPPDFLLVDGFNLPGVTQAQQRLVKGDSRSLSIAAASIVAKVTRDRIMEILDREYPAYGFGRHKGYATQEHLEALAGYGPCPVHRRSFAPIAHAMDSEWLFDKADNSCKQSRIG